MAQVKKGEVYEVAYQRSGITSKGRKWEFVKEGNKIITIFLETPIGLQEGDHFRVLEILDVVTKREMGRNGKEYENVKVTAAVEKLSSEEAAEKYMQAVFTEVGEDEGALPF